MKQVNATVKWWFRLLTVVSTFIFSNSLLAQQGIVKTVTGRVTSMRSDSAIADASVLS